MMTTWQTSRQSTRAQVRQHAAISPRPIALHVGCHLRAGAQPSVAGPAAVPQLFAQLPQQLLGVGGHSCSQAYCLPPAHHTMLQLARRLKAACSACG